MLIERELHIKAYEIDSVGIVSNIVYVKWFEDLRHDFLEKYCPYEDMMREKKSPVLMKTEVEYKIPLTIFDRPISRLWVSKMGRTKWEMSFEISSGDTIHCLGKQKGCYYDMEKKGPTAMPNRLIENYEKANNNLITNK